MSLRLHYCGTACMAGPLSEWNNHYHQHCFGQGYHNHFVQNQRCSRFSNQPMTMMRKGCSSLVSDGMRALQSLAMVCFGFEWWSSSGPYDLSPFWNRKENGRKKVQQIRISTFECNFNNVKKSGFNYRKSSDDRAGWVINMESVCFTIS